MHRDAVAPVAVHGLATGIRRRSAGDDPLGGTTVAPEIGTALRRRQGGGRPLAPEHADRMGAAMGVDLGGVRIHDDGEADTIARSVQATAFTAGSDVYFTKGTYAPGTSGGDHLLAHELAHVVQGSSGPTSAQGPVIGHANDPAEAAADSMADSAVRRLQRQTARVAEAPPAEQAESPDPRLAPLRRQAERAGTVRRWNPFKALIGGKKKKTKKLATKTPVPSPVTTPTQVHRARRSTATAKPVRGAKPSAEDPVGDDPSVTTEPVVPDPVGRRTPPVATSRPSATVDGPRGHRRGPGVATVDATRRTRRRRPVVPTEPAHHTVAPTTTEPVVATPRW